MGSPRAYRIPWNCWLWLKKLHFWLPRVLQLESKWPRWPRMCVWKLKSLPRNKPAQKRKYKKVTRHWRSYFLFQITYDLLTFLLSVSLKVLVLQLTHPDFRSRHGWRENWRKWGRESISENNFCLYCYTVCVRTSKPVANFYKNLCELNRVPLEAILTDWSKCFIEW